MKSEAVSRVRPRRAGARDRAERTSSVLRRSGGHVRNAWTDGAHAYGSVAEPVPTTG